MADNVTEQVGLSSWSTLQLVESGDMTTVDGHVSAKIRCPDCGQAVSDTKGSQPLPDDSPAEKTFGWRCSDCHNVIPCRAFNPEAGTFNDNYRGIQATFRGGHSRYIPVPARYVDTAADSESTDGGQP